jgi:hypothetical protein
MKKRNKAYCPGRMAGDNIKDFQIKEGLEQVREAA